MKYVYDIECLSNFFSVVFISTVKDNDTPHTFVIHKDRNDFKELKEFCEGLKLLVGYNNLGYDWPLLSYVLSKEVCPTPEEIYLRSNLIINSERSKSREYIKQLDLYKMNHFDSDVKRVSLKHLQFAMRYPNVMDMPIHHTSKISKEDFDTILEYNVNDVLSTKAFLYKCIKEIKVRKTIGNKYNLDLTNDSEPSVSKKVFGKILSSRLGISYEELKEMRTKRDVVNISDVILPYVNFKSPEFNFILDWFKSKSISVLKGAFSDLDITDMDRKYMNKKRFKKKKKGKNISLYSDMHVMFDGEEYVYGAGGIHSRIEGKTVIPKDDEMIVDLDVKKAAS